MGSCSWWCLWEHLVLGQGCFIAVVLAVGWYLAARARHKELLRQLAATACTGVDAATDEGHDTAAQQLPGVTVVLPVKGCREHSKSNWASHLRMAYDGPLEYVFVVESAQDAACSHVQALLCDGPMLQVRMVVAGTAAACSQKIHKHICRGAGALVPGAACRCCSLLTGIQSSSPGHEYVLCLDDDVELHPGCLKQLVNVMQQDNTLFMATGYPFDLPPPHSSLLAYCVLVYHLPLLIAFSVSQRTNFVWGGCMMLRRHNLIPKDAYGVLKAWRDGGYSDDLLLAALCTEHGLPIAVPSFALFPQWLEKKYSLHEYLNYLHRQLYVLDTYSNRHNHVLNHTMMAIHSWASASWAASGCVVLYKTVTWLLAALSSLVPTTTMAWTSTATPTWAHSTTQACDATQAVLPDLPPHVLAGHRTEPIQPPEHCTCSSWWLLMFLASMITAHMSLLWMTGVALRLLRSLDPARKLSAWPWQHFNYGKLWLALMIESCLLPLVVLYTLCCPYVTWSGMQYKKQQGRVVCLGNACALSSTQGPKQQHGRLHGLWHKLHGFLAGTQQSKHA